MTVPEETRSLPKGELTIRCAAASDAEDLIRGLRCAAGESRFLVSEPEEITFTVEDEVRFIEGMNSSPNSVMLLAFWNGEYAGNASIRGSARLRLRHRGDLGIALYERFTNLGIGSALLDRLIALAPDMALEQLELEVSAENLRAIALYEKKGFTRCGAMPRGMKFADGSYADLVHMVRSV